MLSFFALFWLFFNGTNRDMNNFYNEFGVNLPEDASVIYKEVAFGAMGDGESLVIYSVSSKSMEGFTKKGIIRSWAQLPINKGLYTELHRKIGIDNKEIAKHMNLGWQNGYYYIKDRFMSYNPKLKAQLDFEYHKLHNFSIGIIDVKENNIYFYRYNQ